jgi:hypothetical protein
MPALYGRRDARRYGAVGFVRFRSVLGRLSAFARTLQRTKPDGDTASKAFGALRCPVLADGREFFIDKQRESGYG